MHTNVAFMLCSFFSAMPNLHLGDLGRPSVTQVTSVGFDDGFLPKPDGSLLSRVAKATLIARMKHSILQSELLLGASGLKIDGISYDYIKVRGTPLVFRYGKDGTYNSVSVSPIPTERPSRPSTPTLEGKWRSSSIILVIRKGRIDRVTPYKYFVQVEDDIIIYLYGLINPVRFYSTSTAGSLVSWRDSLPGGDDKVKLRSNGACVSCGFRVAPGILLVFSTQGNTIECGLWFRLH